VRVSHVVHVVSRCVRPRVRERNVAPRATWVHVAETSSYIIGKGIILFTMFYCTMNWWRYRREREEAEEAEAAEAAEDAQKKKDKK